ncbi:hypothetical protein [Acinetobacter dispersus]|uniref:Uncharacterized protein n=1 Tax=Acinetobacter dispersus TaxID=70348 RepID=N9MQN1_9GAMM|nr:hypothetical protein [Acinetobacter dispersus]ENW93046.1 hypothetical protein F904_02989 [Acinetobacter dispersus]
MYDFFNFIFEKLKNLLDISTIFFKLSIFFGIVMSLNYFRKINYLPKDLTIGDGLSFILISCKFALIFIFFIGSIVVGSGIVNLVYISSKKIYKWRKLLLPMLILKATSILICDLATLKFYEKCMIAIGYIFALWGSYIFYPLFWQENLLGFLLYFLCCVIAAVFIHVFEFTKNRTDLPIKEQHTQMVMALVFTAIFPLIIYGYFSDKYKLSDFSTSSLTETDKNAVLYLKKEEVGLFPSEIIEKTESDEYVILTHTMIRLRGFGRNALVEYLFRDNEGVLRGDQVEVPNDAIQIKWKLRPEKKK